MAGVRQGSLHFESIMNPTHELISVTLANIDFGIIANFNVRKLIRNSSIERNTSILTNILRLGLVTKWKGFRGKSIITFELHW